MQFYITITVYVASVTALNLSSEERITNGKLAHRHQFPYQVGLLLTHPNYTSWCGGSLIAHNWVLTAAHCFLTKVTAVTVELGSKTRFKPSVSYAVDPNAIIIHPGWNEKKAMNDIALVNIPSVTYNVDIQPVKLPKIARVYSTYSSEYAIASGWGKTSDSTSDKLTNELYFAKMSVLPNNVCKRTYKSFITDRHLCVSTLGGVSTCRGDSGGPLVLKSTKVLIGVSSFTMKLGCTKNYPAVFSRVTSFLSWIKNHTGISV